MQILISGFRRDVDEICALLGYYAASCGNCLPTFRDTTPRNFPEERIYKCKSFVDVFFGRTVKFVWPVTATELENGYMIVPSQRELRFPRTALYPGFDSGICGNNMDVNCGLISACC
jgi:hypothetical protein